MTIPIQRLRNRNMFLLWCRFSHLEKTDSTVPLPGNVRRAYIDPVILRSRPEKLLLQLLPGFDIEVQLRWQDPSEAEFLVPDPINVSNMENYMVWSGEVKGLQRGESAVVLILAPDGAWSGVLHFITTRGGVRDTKFFKVRSSAVNSGRYRSG
jgi:hypothetical protein